MRSVEAVDVVDADDDAEAGAVEDEGVALLMRVCLH